MPPAFVGSRAVWRFLAHGWVLVAQNILSSADNDAGGISWGLSAD